MIHRSWRSTVRNRAKTRRNHPVAYCGNEKKAFEKKKIEEKKRKKQKAYTNGSPKVKGEWSFFLSVPFAGGIRSRNSYAWILGSFVVDSPATIETNGQTYSLFRVCFVIRTIHPSIRSFIQPPRSSVGFLLYEKSSVRRSPYAPRVLFSSTRPGRSTRGLVRMVKTNRYL